MFASGKKINMSSAAWWAGNHQWKRRSWGAHGVSEASGPLFPGYPGTGQQSQTERAWGEVKEKNNTAKPPMGRVREEERERTIFYTKFT